MRAQYARRSQVLAGAMLLIALAIIVQLTRIQNSTEVSRELGLNYDQLINVIQYPPEGLSYLVLADFIDAQKALNLQELKRALQEQAASGTLGGLTGLQFKAHPQRSYPENALASNILGFVNREGKGYFGIEENYDNLLAGNAVRVLIPTDPNKAYEIPRVPDGTTMILQSLEGVQRVL